MYFKPLFVSACLLSSVHAAIAQDVTSAAEKTTACLDIATSEQRLLCFEGAASELADALASASEEGRQARQVPGWADPPQPKPDRTQQAAQEGDAREDKTPLWARLVPKIERGDAPEAIQVSVVRILRNNVGRHFFLTEDGQEWEQTMTEIVNPPRSLPAPATIKGSVFGNPALTFDDGPNGAYKVRRVK